MATQYDAILLVSFGGPEGLGDVIPFLENVAGGRKIPSERMLAVAEHYQHFSGVSPLNEQNRELIAALRQELVEHGPHLPVYWGNRNWHPMLAATMQQMTDDGVQRAIAFVTSAFSSYSSCRQYREDIQRARESAGAAAPEVDKLRVYYNHPGFIEPTVDHVRQALAKVPAERRSAAPLIFTAHSLPRSMAEGCNYQWQLQEACRLVSQRVGDNPWQLVFQSRSGPPQQPWLEPDVCDYIRQTHENKALTDVIIVPIGFISDHMEVIFDLDTEAKELCDALGIDLQRAATVGTDPRFVTMIRQLILERMSDEPDRPALGTHGPSHDVCPEDCCLAEIRPRQPSV